MYIGTYSVLFFYLVTEVVLDVKLKQKDLSMTKGIDKTVFISCEVTGLSDSNYVHWYQKKEGEALTRILYVKKGSQVVHDSKYPDAKEFDVNKLQQFDLKIAKLKKSHSAVYYCASWDSGRYTYKAFGSGTRLIVTDGNDKDKVIEPTVHVYPVSKPQNQKSVLLCEAKGMVPDLVRFRWEAKNNKNELVELKDDDQLEQRDQDSEVRITSMLIVEESKATNNKFTCSVQHGTTGEKKHVIPTEEEIRKSKQIPSKTPPTCPPKKAVAKAEMEEEEENMNIGVLKIDRSLYLFSMTYVILLVKNVLYFCTIFVLLFKRSLASTEFIKAR